jgi:ADP-ribose pyrophosphatase YjhB (NUDIX family)
LEPGRVAASGIIVHSPQGRVLLQLRAHRPQTDDEGLKWGIWGGRVEEGETPREAASRELKEETGLEGEPVFWSTGRTLRGHPVYTFSLVCDEETVRFLDPAETVRAEWFSREDLGRLRLAYDHGEVIARFLASPEAPGAR